MIAPHLHKVCTVIRNGSEPNNPALLQYLVTEQINYANQYSGFERNHIESLFRVLLDAASDELVPSHWRALCLDYMHAPLSALWDRASCDESRWQVAKLCSEFRIVGDYAASTINFID